MHLTTLFIIHLQSLLSKRHSLMLCINEIVRGIAELILYLIFNITSHPLYSIQIQLKDVTNITRTLYISETSKSMYLLDF